MEILETPPLDSGASPAYKDLVQDKLRPLRAQALALMTHSLHRYYQKQDVGLVCWWNDHIKTDLNIPDKSEPAKSADSWHVQVNQMPNIPDGDGAPIYYAIASLSKDDDAKKTVTPRLSGAGAQLRDLKALRANTTWRFLQDRGYINSDHSLSSWGKALKAAFDGAIGDGKKSNSAETTEMEDAILMAFELLRLDLLSSSQMFPLPPYTGTPMRGSETDKAYTSLISRIACLGTFQHDAIGYTGPLSRSLLAYHQCAAAVRGALRDLVEMHACNMFLSGAVGRNLAHGDYTDLGASLPFVDEPDLGLALVVKSHLDELSNEPSKRTDIKKWFNFARDIEGDLEKAWSMWDAVSTAIDAFGIADTDVRCRSTQVFKQLKQVSSTRRRRRPSREPMTGSSKNSSTPMHLTALHRRQK